MKLTSVASALLMAASISAAAQNYPSGPVKLIVPVPAGGVTDTMARIVGQRLNERSSIGDRREPRRGATTPPERRRWRARLPTD